MIKAIFFDFYNTLASFWPSVEDIQETVCRELGIFIDAEGILNGYHIADDYFSRENSKKSLAKRSRQARIDFFSRYEQLILSGAGVDVTLELAGNIWDLTTKVSKELVAFDDALPALTSLKKKGYTTGVVSNIYGDMESLIAGAGLKSVVDCWITSQEVGVEKPDSRIFNEAIKRVGIKVEEGVYVGDQYYSDVEGSRSAGMTPVLVDRNNFHQEVSDCIKVSTLTDLEKAINL